MCRQQFRPVGALGTRIYRLPRAALRWPWAGRDCPVGAQDCCWQRRQQCYCQSPRWVSRGGDSSASGDASYAARRDVSTAICATCETTHRNGSRNYGGFGGRKAESEITVKKLGAKNTKTTAQVEKCAAVISLRNTFFGIRGREVAFSSKKSRGNWQRISSAFCSSANWSEDSRSFSRIVDKGPVKKPG